MTPSETTPSVETSDEIGDFIRCIAHIFESEGNVRTVFGPPVKLDTRTVVPVARVSIGGGGGGVRSLGATIDGLRALFAWTCGCKVPAARTLAGGGGLGIDVRPIGFLSEEDGRVVFTRIDDARAASTKER